MMKRTFDIVTAVVALMVLSPILAVTALCVRFYLGSPVLFRQLRPGLRGEPFQMVKFRTMTNARGTNGELLSDGQRLPKFGKFLRSTSLDELPGLLNVIKGNMSIVGPRPLLMQYLPLYSQSEARRHEVRPGLTGLAQVNGRNNLSWPDRFVLDVWYVDNRSLWLDLKIICLTIWKVIRRKDIARDGDATMPVFDGHRDDLRESTR